MPPHGSVVQGYFPYGLRLTDRPGWVQQAVQMRAPAVRQKMESLFGARFDAVRVHIGPHVGLLGAHALTCGTDVHFAPGQYEPDTHRGRHLLGHELAHVVQQKAGRVRNPFGTGVAVFHDALLEAEAERMGARAAWLQDNPHIRGVDTYSKQQFETTALATKGKDAGTYYSSVKWGWAWNDEMDDVALISALTGVVRQRQSGLR